MSSQTKSASGKSKKYDDLNNTEATVDIQEDQTTLEFGADEIPVTKPGILEKRERKGRGPSSRVAKSPEQEYFDIE